MTRRIAQAFLAAGLLFLSACNVSKTVTIGLDPDPFDIIALTSSGTITDVVVDPNALGGSDYRDNKDKIDEVTLNSLELEIVSVNTTGTPANAATQLTAATLVVTDQVTNETHAYTVDPAVLPIALTVRRISLGAITPAASDAHPVAFNAFLTQLLKTGNTFRVSGNATVNQAPVNVTCRLHFSIDLHITVRVP